LSAGQAQRIGLARALYGDPVLIALDEPNAHLDGDGETALMNALRAASERGACSVLVAHRTGLVNVANKIMVVREGRIEAFGPREQVMARIGPGPRPVPSPNETSGVRP
jgi:ATP-binding cassette subfamily C protein